MFRIFELDGQLKDKIFSANLHPIIEDCFQYYVYEKGGYKKYFKLSRVKYFNVEGISVIYV